MANFTVFTILPGRSGDYFDFFKRGMTVNDRGEKLPTPRCDIRKNP